MSWFGRRVRSILAGGLLVVFNSAAAELSPVISEFMAANSTALADEDGDFSDWIEIFNQGSATLNLNGWFLTDDPNLPAKWILPGTNLPPSGRMIVFASGKDRRVPGLRLHANFQLSADGEYLGLARPDGIVVSSFSPAFPKQRPDVSYGSIGNAEVNDFLAAPTPGTPNGSTAAQFVADTKFSHERGFYETNFALTITCATPGATIHFTTNGSPPSATNGLAYTVPIPIAGTTTIRARASKSGARASNIDTHTYLFLGDVIAQSTNGVAPPGWPARWGDNKVDYGMDPDIVAKPPWNGTISNDLRAIPSLSLVMRLDDLFNTRTGIYANPGGEGRDWERPCSLELIHPDGRAGFAVRTGVRIRGGFSRNTTNPKHSLRFLMRDEYGEAKLRFPFFGPTGSSEIDKFDLRTSQDGSWAFLGDPNGLFLNDPFSRDTLLALGQPGERGDWYHLYINGQYWGLYNSCERPEASFAASYLGGAPEDWDVLKPDPQEGYVMKVTDGNDAAWTRLWRAATNGFAGNANYFRVQGRNPDGGLNPAFENLLDVTNLVDYLLVIFWAGNYDGPLYGGFDNGFLNNYYAFRERGGTRGGFRFLTHDAELSLGSLGENRISTTTIGDPARGDEADRCNPYYLWTRLLPNAEFKTLVADRVQKHFFGAGALTREACTARFAARTNEIYRAITGESARWGDAQRANSPITPNHWRNAIDDRMTDYFPFRANEVLDQLRDAGVFPSLSAPAFSRPDGEAPIGFAVALSHANGTGEIFYTTDGSDPRAIGGGIGPGAVNYDAPIVIAASTLVRTRVRDGGSWSPLVEANYYPAQDFSTLRVTEIHYNPPGAGAISGDEFEFLELKNSGTNFIDLGGASFTGIVFTFTNGTSLAPGQFFLLGRNAASFGARYPGVTLNGVYTGKLDNAGEEIAIKTGIGVEMASLTYEDRAPWPATPDGHGFSLVPINATGVLKSGDGAQWRASASVGGSPGRDDAPAAAPPIVINEILTHTDPPDLDMIELFNPTPNDVNLGGWFLTDDGSIPRKFRIPDGTSIAAGRYVFFTEANFNTGPAAFSLGSDGGEVYLFSGTPGGTNLTGYSHGFKFGAAANGASFGRYVNSAADEMFPAQIASSFGLANAGPRVGPAVINEIHFHPSTNYDEYIEALNVTASPLELFDAAHPANVWRLGGLGFDFPPQTTLPPNGLVLIVGIDPLVFRSKYGVAANVPVLGPFAGKLQDSGERLELQRPDAPATNGVIPYVTVDEVRYNDRAPWPPAADGDGPALQRLLSGAFGNEPANWFASGLTPGRPNHLNQAPVVSLASPANGSEFTLPAIIQLEATANDPDGSVTRVEFFDGATRIGEATNAPYRMTWLTPSAGTRQLSAKARDNELASTPSVPIGITVHPPILGSGFGLRAEYFDDLNFGGEPVTRVDENIDFTWPGQPQPGLGVDGFSVRWTGRIQPLVTGTFTFHALSADGVRLWIGGTILINHWTDHAETEDTASVMLEAGQLYDLKLEFYNASGEARIQLAWSAPGLPRQTVPRGQLYPPSNAANRPPAIALTSPANHSGFPPGNLLLAVNASDPDGAIYKVRYFSDGALLGESLAPPFQFSWPNPPRGSHTITAAALDDNLVALTGAPVTMHIVSGFTTNETLIATGSSWKYWDRGSLPGANWPLPDYDDSGWSNGVAQLGYGDNDEATTLGFGPDANNKFVTTYFRRSFAVTAPETVTALRFRLIRDDGLAVYLNGRELLRDNLAAGALDFDTLALSALGTPDESSFIVATVPVPPLSPGANLLACELHQGANDSSDISFELELTATRSVLAPFIVAQPSGVTGNLGGAVNFGVTARGAPPLRYQWQLAGANLPGANAPILTLADFHASNVGDYSVVISNSLGAITSVVATATLSTTLDNHIEMEIEMRTGTPQLRFQRPAGVEHRVESSFSLAPALWSALTNLPALPVSQPFQLNVSTTNRATQFFRIVLP